MTEQENKILFYLIEPEGNFNKMWLDDDMNYEVAHPNLTTPEWKVKLQEWLCDEKQDSFFSSFYAWCLDEIVWDEGYKTTRAMIRNLAICIFDFLRTPEAQARFGWVECPRCGGTRVVGWAETSEGFAYNLYCDCITGKIKAPWLKAMEE